MKPAAAARVAVLLAAVLLSCVAHGPTEKVETVKISILPEHSLNRMAERYAPLIEHLQRSLGARYRVEWISCPSPEAFMATAEREQPDLSIQDAFHTGLLAKLQDARPFLQMSGPGGERTRHGVVAASEKSGIADLAGLRGRTVAVSSKRSYLGFISPMLQIQRAANLHGHDVRIVTVRWQDEVAARLLAGDVDAGFIAGEEAPPGLRVLAQTESVAADCVVIFPKTDPEVAARVREALVDLDRAEPMDRTILDAMGISAFLPLDSDTWSALRSMADASMLPY